MANHASHAALPYPIKGARYTVLIPYLDADGDPTDPTTPDTEVSKDDGTATDTAEEVASPKNSVGMLTLTGAETDCSALSLAAKAASGPKTTLATLYPRVLGIVESGTAQAGAAGTITLASGAAAFDLAGCFVKTTGGTGGGGTGGANNQARRITAYNTSSKVATVVPNWETNPSSDTTYEILLAEGMCVGALKALQPSTLGRTLAIETDGMAHADLKEWLGAAPNALVSSRVDASVGAMAANVVTAAAIADAAIDRATFAADTGLQTIRSGTAQAGAASAITLDASASATTNFYKFTVVLLTGGTGAGQVRLIAGYDGTTKIATVTPAFFTAPDNTSTFAILPWAYVPGFMDDSITAAALNADAATEIATSVWASGTRTLTALGFTLGAGDLAADTIGASEFSQAAADKVWSSASRTLTALGFTLAAADLAAGTITAAKFAAGAIDATAIATDAIGSAEFTQGAADKVWATASRTLTALGFTLGASDLASDTITAAKIATGAIDADALAADAAQEIRDSVLGGTVTELTSVPAASPTFIQALALLYMALRNKIDITGTAKEVHKDDGTVLGTKTLSDDGTTYSETKMA